MRELKKISQQRRKNELKILLVIGHDPPEDDFLYVMGLPLS